MQLHVGYSEEACIVYVLAGVSSRLTGVGMFTQFSREPGRVIGMFLCRKTSRDRDVHA